MDLVTELEIKYRNIQTVDFPGNNLIEVVRNGLENVARQQINRVQVSTLLIELGLVELIAAKHYSLTDAGLDELILIRRVDLLRINELLKETVEFYADDELDDCHAYDASCEEAMGYINEDDFSLVTVEYRGSTGKFKCYGKKARETMKTLKQMEAEHG